MTAPRGFLADTNLVSLAIKHKMGRLKNQNEMNAANWYESLTKKPLAKLAGFASCRRQRLRPAVADSGASNC